MPYSKEKYFVEPPTPRGCWRGLVIILAFLAFIILILTSCVTDEIIEYRDRIDTVYTVVYQYEDREATITYEPAFEPYVQSFFELVDSRLGRSGMLQVDVNITDDMPPDYRWSSLSEVVDGRWEIRVVNSPGCMEAAVYREMMHCLWGRDYAGVWFMHGDPEQVMTLNFPYCLETHTERERLITEMFGI